MDNAARLIEQIKELLADVEVDEQRRIIDHLATTYRAELKELESRPEAAPGPADTRPSFLQTEVRIEAGEVMLELERRQKADKKRR